VSRADVSASAALHKLMNGENPSIRREGGAR